VILIASEMNTAT